MLSAAQRAAARERARAEGRPWGRPRRLDAAAESRVREMVAAGRSVRAMAKALGIPRSTIGRYAQPFRVPKVCGPGPAGSPTENVEGGGLSG